MKKNNRLSYLMIKATKPISLYRRCAALLNKLHMDWPMALGLLLLSAIGLLLMYSAANADSLLLKKQLIRYSVVFIFFITAAQINPHHYYRWAPWLYGAGIALLIIVLIAGVVSNGAQRWLNFGLFYFQPSEFMKLVVPLMLAHYLDQTKLPPTGQTLLISSVLIIFPALLVSKQPDLGTATVIFYSGITLLILSGLPWRLLYGTILLGLVSTPILWHLLHRYQKQRVLTFFSPERDPLGHGYHIIQSKIAIGSGGLTGKGWLHGTQAHLNFIPEHTTDFIYAIYGEEFGLLGGLFLIGVFLFISYRGIRISRQAPSCFTRLLAASLSINFFLAALINISMVIGLLPVVGLPLPLISYGGTTMLTHMISFGIIVSMHSKRNKLVKT